jgi:hypothetical protein
VGRCQIGRGDIEFASIPDWQSLTLTHVKYPIVRQRRIETVLSERPPAAVMSVVTAGPARPASVPAPAAKQSAARKGSRRPTLTAQLSVHCVHCGAVQEDYLLHSEPGDVFFDIAPERAGPVEFTAFEGQVRLSGDYGMADAAGYEL